MAYTEVSITGYNANPPSDDGTEEAQNEVSWGKHKTKIGDPLKNAIEAINDNVKAFSDESFSGQSGTTTLVRQSTAPTGWTKETDAALDDVALRLVSTSTFGNRTGQSSFSTVFGKTATDNHTLTEAQLPTVDLGAKISLNRTEWLFDVDDPNQSVSQGTGSSVDRVDNVQEFKDDLVLSGTFGGDEAHSHDMDIRVNYRDVISVTKD